MVNLWDCNIFQSNDFLEYIDIISNRIGDNWSYSDQKKTLMLGNFFVKLIYVYSLATM